MFDTEKQSSLGVAWGVMTKLQKGEKIGTCVEGLECQVEEIEVNYFRKGYDAIECF